MLIYYFQEYFGQGIQEWTSKEFKEFKEFEVIWSA